MQCEMLEKYLSDKIAEEKQDLYKRLFDSSLFIRQGKNYKQKQQDCLDILKSIYEYSEILNMGLSNNPDYGEDLKNQVALLIGSMTTGASMTFMDMIRFDVLLENVLSDGPEKIHEASEMFISKYPEVQRINLLRKTFHYIENMIQRFHEVKPHLSSDDENNIREAMIYPLFAAFNCWISMFCEIYGLNDGETRKLFTFSNFYEEQV